jgi:hypothetical protein
VTIGKKVWHSEYRRDNDFKEDLFAAVEESPASEPEALNSDRTIYSPHLLKILKPQLGSSCYFFHLTLMNTLKE